MLREATDVMERLWLSRQSLFDSNAAECPAEQSLEACNATNECTDAGLRLAHLFTSARAAIHDLCDKAVARGDITISDDSIMDSLGLYAASSTNSPKFPLDELVRQLCEQKYG